MYQIYLSINSKLIFCFSPINVTGSSSFRLSSLCSTINPCDYSLVWTNTESRVLQVELYMEGWAFIWNFTLQIYLQKTGIFCLRWTISNLITQKALLAFLAVTPPEAKPIKWLVTLRSVYWNHNNSWDHGCHLLMITRQTTTKASIVFLHNKNLVIIHSYCHQYQT